MLWFSKRNLFDNPAEMLTGMVHGKKATDIEERWARAVAKLPDWSFAFRQRISPLTHKVSGLARNLPGELELDFLVQRGKQIIPILIDGEFSHFGFAWQKNVDEQKEAAINQALRAYNANPAMRIPRHKDELWRLSSQDAADALAREVLA